MAKYSYEFKKQVVSEYLNGEGGYKTLAKKHGIPSHKAVIQWVKTFTRLGSESLTRSRNNAKYSFEYKLRIVESYLTSEISYQELALKEGISNSSLIVRWVNDFRIAGPAARRGNSSEEKARIIHSLRNEFKLKDILAFTGFQNLPVCTGRSVLIEVILTRTQKK